MKLYFQKLLEPYPIESLAFFRLAFGLLMFFSILRFFLNGWIDELYIKPEYFFSYYGFEWIKPFKSPYIYFLFGICGLSALGIALGFWYRACAGIFFLSFTYIELMDKSNYLNHYYLISMLSFLFIFLPAHKAYSIDVKLKPQIFSKEIPYYMILILKLQIVSVYFFGGLCKIKYDWLILAQPLKIWLGSSSHWFLLGPIFAQEWAAYIFSWGAMLMDLSLPFLLFYKPTRIYAFFIAIIFHLLTHLLFYIGMFPFIMSACILIFFEPHFHQKILTFFKFHLFNPPQNTKNVSLPKPFLSSIFYKLLPIFIGLQFFLPFRFLLYTGNMLWTEEGFRFAWHIMLIEKAAHLEYIIKEPQTKKQWIERPENYLTKNQVKQLSTQPDMILEFAHFLKDKYQKEGKKVEVYADSYCSLNGRPSQVYVNPSVNLAEKKYTPFKAFDWIIPLNNSQ